MKEYKERIKVRKTQVMFNIKTNGVKMGVGILGKKEKH